MVRRSSNTVNHLLLAVLAVCAILSFFVAMDGLIKPGEQIAQVAVGTGLFVLCVVLILTRPVD